MVQSEPPPSHPASIAEAQQLFLSPAPSGTPGRSAATMPACCLASEEEDSTRPPCPSRGSLSSSTPSRSPGKTLQCVCMAGAGVNRSAFVETSYQAIWAGRDADRVGRSGWRDMRGQNIFYQKSLYDSTQKVWSVLRRNFMDGRGGQPPVTGHACHSARRREGSEGGNSMSMWIQGEAWVGLPEHANRGRAVRTAASDGRNIRFECLFFQRVSNIFHKNMSYSTLGL